jgi:hypothetical protein
VEAWLDDALCVTALSSCYSTYLTPIPAPPAAAPICPPANTSTMLLLLLLLLLVT